MREAGSQALDCKQINPEDGLPGLNCASGIGRHWTGNIETSGSLTTRLNNYFNRPQYADPSTAFGAANFGVIQSTSFAPRIIQFAAKMPHELREAVLSKCALRRFPRKRSWSPYS